MKAVSRLRAWGNSIGIVLPKDELRLENLGVNDEVEITVRKKSNPLREAFGCLKGVKRRTNKTTDELLREVDEALDPK